MFCGLMSHSSRNLYGSHEETAQHSDRTETRRANMLYLLGTVMGLFVIVICFSKGLKGAKKPPKVQPSEMNTNSKMKDLSEKDVHLLAKILSVGLVDADPNYLHHLKGYRDLKGA